MILFVSKTADKLNSVKLDTELLTPNICVNPFYSKVTIGNPYANIFCDSAAFQERDAIARISLAEAMTRQLQFEKKLGIKFNYYASYDTIGNATETLEANKYLMSLSIKNKMVIIQGDTSDQYAMCLQETLKLYGKDDFVLGFGGISRAGTILKVRAKLFNAIEKNLPELKELHHIHLLGCVTLSVVKKIKEYLPDVNLTADTSGIELKSVFGNKFVDGRWIKMYNKSQKFNGYHPCELFKENCNAVIKFYSRI